jgi:hypothetical protein
MYAPKSLKKFETVGLILAVAAMMWIIWPYHAEANSEDLRLMFVGTPTLGNYADTSMVLSGNIAVQPDAVPSGATIVSGDHC